MHDVLDIIRNVQGLYSLTPTLGILKDFERVVDELDVYVFKNWDEGELLTGPIDHRHFVECSLAVERIDNCAALAARQSPLMAPWLANQASAR